MSNKQSINQSTHHLMGFHWIQIGLRCLRILMRSRVHSGFKHISHVQRTRKIKSIADEAQNVTIIARLCITNMVHNSISSLPKKAINCRH